MSSYEMQYQYPNDKLTKIVELAQAGILSRSLDEFAAMALSVISEIANSPLVMLYLADPHSPGRKFFHQGVDQDLLSGIEELCAGKFVFFLSQMKSQMIDVEAQINDNLTFYPLLKTGVCVGLVGTASGRPDWAGWRERAFSLIIGSISRLAEQAEIEKRLVHLNTYLTVSSMLAQSMGLKESLETALYCSMDVVKAEAASVLLLDDEKKNFTFYQVEGPAKPLLAGATFPADKGIAGSVIATQQSTVVNDAANDPRFYGSIDKQSGFKTRNMIAIPLVAGEERIGVLEVLNKANGDSFYEDEHILLSSISEEIAFAIRNANIFEYVVNSYCKQRQGQASCKGCKRPLGSWTPCVKNREATA